MPKVRLQVERPKVISTFAGCGGSILGYRAAGFKDLLAVEWETDAVAFPDDFEFTDRRLGIQRIGNSVPPPLMKAIASHIKEAICNGR